MSRLFNPDDFEFREPGRDPKVVVKEEMARLTTSVKAERPIEMDAATRANLEARDQAQGFIRVNDRLTISPTLAKLLGHRPAEIPRDPAAPIDEGDAEAQSLEAMRHD